MPLVKTRIKICSASGVCTLSSCKGQSLARFLEATRIVDTLSTILTATLISCLLRKKQYDVCCLLKCKMPGGKPLLKYFSGTPSSDSPANLIKSPSLFPFSLPTSHASTAIHSSHCNQNAGHFNHGQSCSAKVVEAQSNQLPGAPEGLMPPRA